MFNLVIGGHKEFETEEEGIKFEQDVLAKMEKFIKSLGDGVTGATFSGGHLGVVPMMPES